MRRPTVLVCLLCMCLAPHPLAGDETDESIDVLMMPNIGEHYDVVEAYLRLEEYGSYLGAVTESDIYGGLADTNGDGRDDLVIVVDHERTCEEEEYESFVFELVVKDRDIETPCDWRLSDDWPKPVTRALYERFVVIGDNVVRLAALPLEMSCTFDGTSWHDYFHFIYDTDFYLPSEKVHRYSLDQICLGTADLNGDGLEEMFINVAPARCPACGGGGHVFERDPHLDGAMGDWKRIGRLSTLDSRLAPMHGDGAPLVLAAVLRLTNDVVEGYRTLCTSRQFWRWNGERYVEHIYVNVDSLRQEAEAIGCPVAAPTEAGEPPAAGPAVE